jgi:hypothetical protein
LPLHASSPFILGGKVEEELHAERFGTLRARYDRSIEASLDYIGEVDVARFPINEGNASRRQVCLGDAPGPIGRPRVILEVNDRGPPEL